jgi:hypothetical protein
MRERGLILTKENRLASVEGRKTQTRRVITAQAHCDYHGYSGWWEHYKDKKLWQYKSVHGWGTPVKSPYRVGDRLYMLEPYQIGEVDLATHRAYGHYLDDHKTFNKPLDYDPFKLWYKRKRRFAKTSSRFMYKSLARYWFEVTDVRAERLQDISVEDIKAEGVVFSKPYLGVSPDGSVIEHPDIDKDPWWFFQQHWDSINKKRGYGWVSNPWVWVYTYKKVKNG